MFRVIDSSINRVSEGLRVIEDIARFKFSAKNISQKSKYIRHRVRNISKQYDAELLNYRDSLNDIGPEITSNLKLERDLEINSIITANFKRVQEGLRTLEEITSNKEFEKLRYNTYQLEKEFAGVYNKEAFVLPDLYGITYSRDSRGRSNITIVKEMIQAGIRLIQYREKDLSLKEMYNECREIRALTRESGVTFIINDFIDIAILVDADGVHIGQDDLPIQEVRKLLGSDKIIGLSTHSPDQAKRAVLDGADYIGVGPIFATQTKVNVCDPVGYSYLEWIVEHIDIPFVAIGGIKEFNISEILKRGAKSVALVSEITGNEDIPGKVDTLHNIIGEYKHDI